MSESDSSRLDEFSPVPEALALMTAGALLKAARESQSIPIAVLASALKVPLKKLEALESDRFDLLPDIVFVRALAASMCRSLKIDSAQILASLPTATSEHLNSKAPAMSVPFRAPRDQLGASFRDQLFKPLTLVVLLLLLGGLAMVFAPLPQMVKLAENSLLGAVVESVQTAPILPATTEASYVPPNTASEIAATPVANENLSLPDVPVTTSEVMDLVVFKARGATWVEVIDATASVKLRKTLVNGDVVSASGVAPLSIVVGRADVVEVHWRNKPVDLMPVARDNVARFEVK
jgi:cytoskeleton protein RodZ